MSFANYCCDRRVFRHRPLSGWR